ncbi:MAG: hypothetical protein AAF845_17380 [Bacteroidota bacterium]
MHYIFASAAHLIENSGASKTDVNVSGLEGAIRAYNALLSVAGGTAQNRFMDRMMETREEGDLEAFIQRETADC